MRGRSSVTTTSRRWLRLSGWFRSIRGRHGIGSGVRLRYCISAGSPRLSGFLSKPRPATQIPGVLTTSSFPGEGFATNRDSTPWLRRPFRDRCQPPTTIACAARRGSIWRVLSVTCIGPHDAERSFRKALELDPNYEEAMFNLAMCLEDMKRPGHTESIALLRRAIEIDPVYMDAIRELGRLLWSRGDAQEGERLLRRSLELCPHDERTYQCPGRRTGAGWARKRSNRCVD